MKQSQIAIIIGAVIVVVGGYILIKTSSGTQPTPPPEPTTVTPSEANSQEGETDAEKNGIAVVEDTETEQDADTAAPANAPTSDEKQTDTTETDSSMVTYTTNGYSPATLRVKKGTPVTFKNESDRQMWTASAIHPTHTVYPGSDIKKCGTDDSTIIFDMCKGYANGQQWSLAFNEAGTWKYHNHLQPTDTGTIVVE